MRINRKLGTGFSGTKEISSKRNYRKACLKFIAQKGKKRKAKLIRSEIYLLAERYGLPF